MAAVTTAICGVLRLDGSAAQPADARGILAAMRPAGVLWSETVASHGPIALAAAALAPAGAVPAPGIPCIPQSPDYLIAGDLALYGAQQNSHALSFAAEAVLDAGAAGAAKLHGDFALAVWNRRRETLTLLRDPFGVRPLYHCHRAGAYFAFASHPGGLLRSGFASRGLNPQGVVSLPRFAEPIAPSTLFAEIASVPAAHALVVRRTGPEEPRRYWSIPAPPALPLSAGPGEVAAELRSRLLDAVERRMPEAGPAGGHMSGGLDSSAISICAARCLPDDAQYHAYGFGEPPLPGGLRVSDETPYIAALAETDLRISPHSINMPGLWKVLLEGVDPDTALTTGADDPEEQILADFAGRGGRVLFSGWGGDQAVTGFGEGALAELFWQGAWATLRRELSAAGKPGAAAFWSRFQAEVLMQSLPPRLRDGLRRLRRGRDTASTAAVTSQFVRARYRHLIPAPVPISGADCQANRIAHLAQGALAGRFEAFNLRGFRHGISYRFPMLDRDLLDFALAIPGIFYRRNGCWRWIFREAMRGVLPEMVRDRQEKLAPFAAEFFRQAQQKAQALETLQALAQDPLVTEYLDPAAIARYLGTVPSEEEALALIEEHTRQGRQYLGDCLKSDSAIRCALFLAAQREA